MYLRCNAPGTTPKHGRRRRSWTGRMSSAAGAVRSELSRDSGRSVGIDTAATPEPVGDDPRPVGRTATAGPSPDCSVNRSRRLERRALGLRTMTPSIPYEPEAPASEWLVPAGIHSLARRARRRNAIVRRSRISGSARGMSRSVARTRGGNYAELGISSIMPTPGLCHLGVPVTSRECQVYKIEASREHPTKVRRPITRMALA
jgi:hypothetical protein